MAKEDEHTEKKILKELIAALERAIERGPWQRGLLFQAIGKKLRHLRGRFARELPADSSHSNEENSTLRSDGMKSSPQKSSEEDSLIVYLSLYMNAGDNIQKWEKLLGTLPSSIVTRPIYKNEEDLRAALRPKENKINDAYISVRIRATDLIHPPGNTPPMDRYGHPLLIVRQGAVQSENILTFMHRSGRYLFTDGRLVRQGDQEYPDFF